MASGVLGEQSVYVGEDQQKIGVHQMGDLSRERVIIPKTNFFHGDRVVFIDDRNHVQFQ